MRLLELIFPTFLPHELLLDHVFDGQTVVRWSNADRVATCPMTNTRCPLE
jgi:hypothetical protein